MSDKVSRRDAVLALGTAVAGPTIASSSVGSRSAVYNAVTPPVSDLHGKTLVVKTANRPLEYPLVLGGCSFETHRGRLFLSGTNVPARPEMYDWTVGIRRLVAWDAVEEYMIFDSVEQYHSRLIVALEEQDSDVGRNSAGDHQPS